MADTTSEQPKESTGMSAILAVLGPAISGIGNIFSATSNVKVTKLNIANAENELKLATANSRAAELQGIIDLEKAKLEKANDDARFSTNIKALGYVIVAGLVGYGIYLFTKKKKTA